MIPLSVIGVLLPFLLIALLGFLALRRRKPKLPSYTIKGPPITPEVLYMVAQALCDTARQIDEGTLTVMEGSGIVMGGTYLDLHLHLMYEERT